VGAISTHLQRGCGSQLTVAHELRKTAAQGAATSVLLATSLLLDAVGGRYFSDCNEAALVDHGPSDLSERFRSVAPYALDPDNTLSIPTTPTASGKRRSGQSLADGRVVGAELDGPARRRCRRGLGEVDDRGASRSGYGMR